MFFNSKKSGVSHSVRVSHFVRGRNGKKACFLPAVEWKKTGKFCPDGKNSNFVTRGLGKNEGFLPARTSEEKEKNNPESHSMESPALVVTRNIGLHI